MMRPLLSISAAFAACLCVSLAAQAQTAPSPQRLPPGASQSDSEPPYVPGDQQKFNEGTAAYDTHHYALAFTIFLELAGDYDLAAMRNVALMERWGIGTMKNPQAAQDMMEDVARRGLPTAQCDLGVMLMDGEAGPPDEKAALPWLEKAALANHPTAQFRLGELFEEGVVVPQDMATAALLYGASARHGNAQAAQRLMQIKGWSELPPGFMDGPDPAPIPLPPSTATPSP